MFGIYCQGGGKMFKTEEFIQAIKSIPYIPLILDFDYRNKRFSLLNLTRENNELSNYDLSNPVDFQRYIDYIKEKENTDFAIGRYNENRTIYDHSDLFSGQERRTVHLGIDIWLEPGIKVISPFDGIVHSFNDNNAIGDYGPTIIMEYELNNKKFWLLFGHLSRESLNGLYKGKAIKQGQAFATLGTYKENGSWPSHLHFQIILDLMGKEGDFYGVSTLSERQKFLSICPDPNLILRINDID